MHMKQSYTVGFQQQTMAKSLRYHACRELKDESSCLRCLTLTSMDGVVHEIQYRIHLTR